MTKSIHALCFFPFNSHIPKTRSKQSRISGFEALLRKSPLKNTETRERALRLLQKLQSNEQVMGAPTQAHERWGLGPRRALLGGAN